MAELNQIPYRPRGGSLRTPPKQAPGFVREAWTQFTLGAVNQTMWRGREFFGNLPARDPNFNPWLHMKGYELYADSLINAGSEPEMEAMKWRIDENLKEKDIQARGEWGWMAALAGAVLDPINLVPIPVSRGLGFVKGAAVGAASNAALAAATDPIRIGLDPTADWNELAYSIGGAALFGGALGGLAGKFMSRGQYSQGRADTDRFTEALSEMEGANVARSFDAAEENYKVITGRTGVLENGRYEPVKIEVVEFPLREKKGPDGNLYHYDDSFGWVMEADRGQPDPRPVAPEIVEALGFPSVAPKTA
jgi:hypothetical protein